MLWIIAIVLLVFVILVAAEAGGSIFVDWIAKVVKRRSKNRYLQKYADILVAILVFFVGASGTALEKLITSLNNLLDACTLLC